jgi:hypothetical protein
MTEPQRHARLVVEHRRVSVGSLAGGVDAQVLGIPGSVGSPNTRSSVRSVPSVVNTATMASPTMSRTRCRTPLTCTAATSTPNGVRTRVATLRVRSGVGHPTWAPPERACPAAELLVPACAPDSPPGWARTGRGVNLLIRRLVRAVRRRPVEAPAQVERRGQSVGADRIRRQLLGGAAVRSVVAARWPRRFGALPRRVPGDAADINVRSALAPARRRVHVGRRNLQRSST